MIDFHTHILPEIDDGSSSAEESVVLLRMLREQGVDSVILTPHFYAYSYSAEAFDETRSDCVKILHEALIQKPIDIEIYLGCEVLYFEELWRVENLKSFCIKGTDYILIEMPFSEWTDTMIRGIEKIMGKGITPVIAHFERYIQYRGNQSKIYELLEMGALLQMNCSFLNSFFTRRQAVKFIKKGMVAFLGTDCHNLTDRTPNYYKADKYLKKKLSDKQYTSFISRQKRFLSHAEKIYPK